LSFLLFLLPASAGAIDPALCADDGVTEVPSFAASRDSDQCLLVDPGNGDAFVPFQYEQFHKTGVSVGCDNGKRLSSTTAIEHNLNSYGRCRTKDDGEYCSILFWDVTWDNYLDPACKNQDIITLARPLEYVYFKDVNILNAWKCNQEGATTNWQGPNGISCSAGEDSGAHTDGIQFRGVPVNGGWLIMQDSSFLNGLHYHFLQQVQSEYGPNGSAVFQNVAFGRKAAVGEATNWISDCLINNTPNQDSTITICNKGKTLIGYDAKEYWLIDVHGTALFSLRGSHQKIVVVNTGCGKNGCGGSIGYDNGWPHPVNGSGLDSGPGSCPNGSIGKCAEGVIGSCYCYTSLENARADGHKLPPFVHLSSAGWEDSPAASGGPAGPPLAPILIPPED
jgi:hypothetical protein